MRVGAQLVPFTELMQNLEGIFYTVVTNSTSKCSSNNLGIVAQNIERGLARNGHKLTIISPVNLIHHRESNQ
jgi:hypothetical protein